jgi:hypothetical protein
MDTGHEPRNSKQLGHGIGARGDPDPSDFGDWRIVQRFYHQAKWPDIFGIAIVAAAFHTVHVPELGLPAYVFIDIR